MQTSADEQLRLQLRFRADREPELYQFMTQMPLGERSGYWRRFLRASFAAGLVTPRGLAIDSGEREKSLSIQLDMAREETEHLRELLAAHPGGNEFIAASNAAPASPPARGSIAQVVPGEQAKGSPIDTHVDLVPEGDDGGEALIFTHLMASQPKTCG